MRELDWHTKTEGNRNGIRIKTVLEKEGVMKLLIFVLGFSLILQSCDVFGDGGVSNYNKAMEYLLVDQEKSIRFMAESASEGYGPAQYQMAQVNRTGTPFHTINLEKAFYWMKLAAKQETEHSNLDLGIMYFEGIGTEVNYEKAKEQFLIAAQLGDGKGYSNIGKMYLNGIGVEKNLSVAKMWFNKGAKLGEPDSEIMFSVLDSCGSLDELESCLIK